jgi:DNA-binding XRE family transcriptional regulator
MKHHSPSPDSLGPHLLGDPFRGVFDCDPWAADGRDPATGVIRTPLGPPHVHKELSDGSFHLGPQIAHRLTWWLSEMRLRAHLTQTELAEEMCTTQAAVAKWETGRTLISLDRLARFSDVTRCGVALYFDFGGPIHRRAMWL